MNRKQRRLDVSRTTVRSLSGIDLNAVRAGDGPGRHSVVYPTDCCGTTTGGPNCKDTVGPEQLPE